MFERVNELKRCIGSHSLGRDRWGRTYWHFNSIPCIYIESTTSADENGDIMNHVNPSSPPSGDVKVPQVLLLIHVIIRLTSGYCT